MTVCPQEWELSIFYRKINQKHGFQITKAKYLNRMASLTLRFKMNSFSLISICNIKVNSKRLMLKINSLALLLMQFVKMKSLKLQNLVQTQVKCRNLNSI